MKPFRNNENLLRDLVISEKPIVITVDSGACDAVCPPKSFEHTHIDVSNVDRGNTYGACGGETVTNIGCKHVRCLTGEGSIQKYDFQVGDKLTKPLLAVSKICETGKSVFFGPAPKFESFIVDDPDAFVVSNGKKTKICLANGTYGLHCHEIFDKPKETMNAVGDSSAQEEPPNSGDSRPSGEQVPEVPPPIEVQDGEAGDSFESQEEAPVKVKPNPMQPTKKQIEEHLARSHNPYRSWCDICVRASGKEDPHRHLAQQDRVIPVFVCDYAFLKSDSDPEDKITIFVLKECNSRSLFACVCPTKGTECTVAANLYLDAIQELGYKHCTIQYKNDQEPALMAVVDIVSKSRVAATLPENSPVGSSASNGAAENAVDLVKGLIRRGRLAVEHRFVSKLPLKHMSVPWLVQHVCFCHNRFSVGKDGKTPYSRSRGKDFDKALVEFGERVLYIRPHNHIGPNLNQADVRAEFGIFLGLRPISNEIYIGTPSGIKKVRTIHRVSDDKKWIIGDFESFKGLPWNFEADSAKELPAEAQLRPAVMHDPYSGDPDDQKIQQNDVDVQPRNFKIYESDLQRFGYTPDCPGCRAKLYKRGQRDHNNECRARIKSELIKTESGRRRVESAARRVIAGPRDRGAVPEPLPELDDEDRADLDLPEAAVPEAVAPEGPELYSPASPAEEEDSMSIEFLANLAYEYIKFGNHVSEVYSPPRVAKLASKVNLSPGFSLDLRENDPDDGQPWDFNIKSKRDKLRARVESERPLLLVGCPPCTAFSTLFSSNHSRMNPLDVREKIREGLRHLLFCIELYKIQVRGGRYFLHEHPWGAWSWKVPAVRALMCMSGVSTVKGHMCTHGMYVDQSDGVSRLALKATGWMSNSQHILDELNHQCTNLRENPKHYHEHADLQNGRAEQASIYPEQLCYSILRGLRMQMRELGISNEHSIGSICEDVDEHAFIQSLTDPSCEYYDDLSGKKLDPALVHAARMDEIKGILSHGVWSKCPVSECMRVTGKLPVGTRWVDINKGDDQNPNYRSRLVGREFKGKDVRDDLFAATPPLEAIRTLISLAASQRGISHDKLKKLCFIDVAKAYFHAPVKRSVYVRLPDEALETHERDGKTCGKLHYSLYGTRDAAQNWEEKYCQFLVGLGFVRGLSSPCIFHHKLRDMSLVVHGDDFTTLGVESSLKWLIAEFQKEFKIKMRGILGPDEHDSHEITLLNRVVSWTPDGIQYEADQRHVEILLDTTGYREVKGVVTPGITEPSSTVQEDDDEPLDEAAASLYRAAAARCNFLGLDRPDIQYAAKEVSRSMSKPCRGDLRKLHRLCRYLKQHPRAVFMYRHQALPDRLDVFSDSNWAGCLKTRKSTQGGATMLGQHCCKTWSSTQGIVALSSGEAEFYGIVKASSVGLGCRAMLRDMGLQMKLNVHTDAEAAKGIASRTGLGKTRHIAVHYLWVQERVRAQDLFLHKVRGTENPADLMTKHLHKEDMLKHMNTFCFAHKEGRSALTPEYEAA